MSCNWFSTKYDYFHEFLLTQFWLFALNISVCPDTEHEGNRYPAARNSASPSETFTQQLNTPETVTILQGVNAKWLVQEGTCTATVTKTLHAEFILENIKIYLGIFYHCSTLRWQG